MHLKFQLLLQEYHEYLKLMVILIRIQSGKPVVAEWQFSELLIKHVTG